MHITYTGESIGRNIGKVYGNLVQMNPSNGFYITSMRNSIGDNVDGEIRVKLVLPPAVNFL